MIAPYIPLCGGRFQTPPGHVAQRRKRSEAQGQNHQGSTSNVTHARWRASGTMNASATTAVRKKATITWLLQDNSDCAPKNAVMSPAFCDTAAVNASQDASTASQIEVCVVTLLIAHSLLMSPFDQKNISAAPNFDILYRVSSLGGGRRHV